MIDGNNNLDVGKINDMLHRYVESYMDRHYDVADEFSSFCGDCRSGKVRGDWVPYGSTYAQLPDMICDCVWQKVMDRAQDMFESGELVIKNGSLVEAD